jgi:AcrR family transcriptional regulator
VGNRSTRDALMDAALEQLTHRGVLAGLNLREVADAVGVTPANIYHLFGSRQGLLRAALARETEHLVPPLDALEQLSYVERRAAMFDLIAATPELALTALLALDRDPGYRPLPFFDATRARYAAEV